MVYRSGKKDDRDAKEKNIEEDKRSQKRENIESEEDAGNVDNVGQPGVDNGTSDWTATEKDS